MLTRDCFLDVLNLSGFPAFWYENDAGKKPMKLGYSLLFGVDSLNRKKITWKERFKQHHNL